MLNWPDENYAKLYTRDTPNWLMMPWQARALLPLMIRKTDGAGFIDTGVHDVAGLALVVMLPQDVVEVGLRALLELGTAIRVGSGLELPNFVEAQEARKTEGQKKRDQRTKVRDLRRAETRETAAEPVPTLSPPSPQGVPLLLSSALPSSALLCSALDLAGGKKAKKTKVQAELPNLPPKPARSASRQEELYQSLFVLGRKLAAGVDVAPDESYGPAFINKAIGSWLALWPDEPLKEEHVKALAEAGTDLRTVAESRLEELFNAYFELTWPADCKRREGKVDTRDPQPYPFRVLTSAKVWKPLVDQLWPNETRGAA